MGYFYCTRCGADLVDQDGFDPDYPRWYCENCGQLLYQNNDYDDGDDDDDDDDNWYDNVTWYCDRCNACLNDQDGFSDYYDTWECTECGYENSIDEDHIYSSAAAWKNHQMYNNDTYDYEDEEEDDYYYDDDDNEDDNRNYISSSSSSTNRTHNTTASYYQSTRTAKKNTTGDIPKTSTGVSSQPQTTSQRSLISIALLLVIIFLTFFPLSRQIINAKKIVVGYSSYELVTLTYQEATEKLINSGFSEVTASQLYDLEYKDIEKEGTISYIKINGDTLFEASDKYKKNDSVHIYYHSLKRAKISFDSKKVQKYKYHDLLDLLQKQGFVNIECEANYDLTTGFIHPQYSVEKIIVGTKENFTENDSFRIDIKIKIMYHDFKKNAP